MLKASDEARAYKLPAKFSHIIISRCQFVWVKILISNVLIKNTIMKFPAIMKFHDAFT